ncbi:MAG: hypothetical protein ACI8QZ_000503 [Chlamydiales bacterium]|jgi:hypothetical protein
MSADKESREGEDPRPTEGQKPGEEGKTGGKVPQKGPGKPFVFKFKPADPKNDLEFEDMADK